jgi:hypothetical protein
VRRSAAGDLKGIALDARRAEFAHAESTSGIRPPQTDTARLSAGRVSRILRCGVGYFTTIARVASSPAPTVTVTGSVGSVVNVTPSGAFNDSW